MIQWWHLEWGATIVSALGVILHVWLLLYSVGDFRLMRAILPNSVAYRYTLKEMAVAPIALVLLLVCLVPSVWSLLTPNPVIPPTERTILIYGALMAIPVGLCLIAIIESQFRWKLIRKPRRKDVAS